MILIYLFLLIIIVVIYILNKQAWDNWLTDTETINIDTSTQCLINLDTAISVTELPCCYIGGYITASKYVSSIDMVVNPIESYYLTVCQGFCTNGYKDGICNNGVGQQEFDNCVSISKPKNNCSGLSMPVATSGITYYYPYAATSSSCTDVREC